MAAESVASPADSGEIFLYQTVVPHDGLLEVVMRFQVEAHSGLGMIQVEVRDVATNELVGLWAWPGAGAQAIPHLIAQAATWAQRAVQGLMNPEPF